MLNKHPYSVPEGYFEDLQSRLSEIPHMPESKASGWQRVQPYLALAACFCFALFLGQLIQKRTTKLPDVSDTMYEQLVYADMVPHSGQDSIFDMEPSGTLANIQDDDDIIAYLIETGTSIELIDYFSK